MEPEVEAGRPTRVEPRQRLLEEEVSVGRRARSLVIDVRDRPELAADGQRAPWPEPLQRLAQALVRAVSLDDVATAIVTYGTVAAGARCAHVVLLDHRDAVVVSLLRGHAVPSRRIEGVGVQVRFPWNDAIRDASPLVFPSTEELYRAYPDLAPVCALPSNGAVVTLPLTSAGRTSGAVTFGFGRRGRVPSATEATLAEITSLAALATGRAVLYETEHHAAEMLQRAYLPVRLSNIAGLSFASRYLPAGEPLAVGGDWYDAIALPGPRVGLIIGDVAGHGIQAATVMASLRAALRAFATVETSPAEILTHLNTYTCLFKPDAFATALVAIFDPADGRLRYASAGHPPALLAGEDGSADLLTEPLGPPLGVPDARHVHGEQPFPPGSALVIYTASSNAGTGSSTPR